MEGLEYEGEEYIDRNDDNTPFAEPGDDEDEEDELGELGELGDEDDAGNEDEDASDKDEDDEDYDEEFDDEDNADDDEVKLFKYIDDVEDEDDVARGAYRDKERDDYLQTLLSTIEDNDRRQYLAQNPDEDADFVINSYEEEYRRQVQDNDHEYLFSLLETEDYEGDDGVDCWDPHRLQYEFERHYEWFMLESSLAESATPPPSAHDRE
jgi:hypothetical protein